MSIIGEGFSLSAPGLSTCVANAECTVEARINPAVDPSTTQQQFQPEEESIL